MLSQEKRELLIRTYEKTHDANLTAEIFGVNRSTVYARVKEYKETGSTELHTSQRGRKRKITTEDDERIKKLINENNDITIREPAPRRQEAEAEEEAAEPEADALVYEVSADGVATGDAPEVE